MMNKICVVYVLSLVFATSLLKAESKFSCVYWGTRTDVYRYSCSQVVNQYQTSITIAANALEARGTSSWLRVLGDRHTIVPVETYHRITEIEFDNGNVDRFFYLKSLENLLLQV